MVSGSSVSSCDSVLGGRGGRSETARPELVGSDTLSTSECRPSELSSRLPSRVDREALALRLVGELELVDLLE